MELYNNGWNVFDNKDDIIIQINITLKVNI